MGQVRCILGQGGLAHRPRGQEQGHPPPPRRHERARGCRQTADREGGQSE